MPFRLFSLFSLLIMALSPLSLHANDAFYNITHMTNSRSAVDYAVSVGSNAVEVDLTFTDAGDPYRFYHGWPCDCSCANPEICSYIYPSKNGEAPAATLPCGVWSAASGLLAHIATKPGLALVIIDSKVNSSKLADQGAKVIPFLDAYLFGNGYRGQVIVGTAKTKSYAYLESAAKAANSSAYKDRYSFSIDQEGDDVVDVLRKLSGLPNMSNARAYGTGTSACALGSYTDAITLGYANEKAGASGMTYIWTIDRTSSMKTYIQAGARGIITNRPKALAGVIRDKGLTLARPGDAIPRATRSAISSVGDCDCDYSPGGCEISKAAPAGFACDCSYKGAWTCGGDVTACSNRSASQCLRPDKSKAACKLGGGDCDGY